MTKIKAILFDKDGTLFDFAATWEAWAQAFLVRLSGGDTARAAAIGNTIGFDLSRKKFSPQSVVIAGTPGEIAKALHPWYPDLSQSALLEVLNEEAASAHQREAVPLSPLLTNFRTNGLRLGVATNDAEQPARAHLDQAGIIELFDFIAGYDSGYGAKPAPGQLLAFAEQMQIEPAQILMVGDSTHDLRAGRAAGMVPIGVLTGIAGLAELEPFADAVFADIGALPKWLAARGD